MKKLSVSALALAAALVAAPAAHADTTPGWYVGAGVGGTFGQDQIIHAPRSGEHSIRDEDANVNESASGGYAWDNGLRLEGEYFHDQVNANHENGRQGSGHTTNNDVFLNALYDFKTGTIYTPYVGAGVGPDFVNVKSLGSARTGYLKGDTLVGAYQGIAGVSAQLDANWAVTADYRYIASFDPKVDSTFGGQGRTDNASHNVIVGVRYSFGEPTPMHTAAAPMVPMHAAGAPAVAGVPQSFVVFFDFNKSTLTPEAKRIIASAAAAYKKNGYASISVTGHTDTVGSDKYNLKLSQRRAEAVETELKKLGVGMKHITETGVGKEGLLVPTADGVREAQNRRAEIVLSK
jgi:outer membrane protein OmpA-like peptidoglycan-associated protein